MTGSGALPNDGSEGWPEWGAGKCGVQAVADVQIAPKIPDKRIEVCLGKRGDDGQIGTGMRITILEFLECRALNLSRRRARCSILKLMFQRPVRNRCGLVGFYLGQPWAILE